MAWLEEDGARANADGEAPKSGKRPPRLPGAARTLPPMPVPPSASIAAMPAVRVPTEGGGQPAGASAASPPRHKTMEVDMNWVELVDEGGTKRPVIRKKHVPIPREDD